MRCLFSSCAVEKKKRDRGERSMAVEVGACVCANRDLPCISSKYAKYGTSQRRFSERGRCGTLFIHTFLRPSAKPSKKPCMLDG